MQWLTITWIRLDSTVTIHACKRNTHWGEKDSLTDKRHLCSKKLFALAAQKFIADVATDAFQFNKVRQSSSSTRTTTKANKEKKIILNMDDLSSALTEYGVHVKKPDFYSWKIYVIGGSAKKKVS